MVSHGPLSLCVCSYIYICAIEVVSISVALWLVMHSRSSPRSSNPNALEVRDDNTVHIAVMYSVCRYVYKAVVLLHHHLLYIAEPYIQNTYLLHTLTCFVYMKRL